MKVGDSVDILGKQWEVTYVTDADEHKFAEFQVASLRCEEIKATLTINVHQAEALVNA